MLAKKEEKKSVKIGVLLPQSSLYPEISKRFLDGLKLCFTINENNFTRGEAELIVEDVGLGTERICIEKVRKLASQDEVSLIVGLLEFNTAFQVGLVADLMGVPSLFSGLGESTVPAMELPDSTFFCSLQLWQSYYALGNYFRRQAPDKPFHIITSFYDCGYDPLRAFRLGIGQDLYGRETILKATNRDELAKEVATGLQLSNDERCALLLHPILLRQVIELIGNQLGNVVAMPFYDGPDGQNKYWGLGNIDRTNSRYVDFSKGVKEYLESPVELHHILGYLTGEVIYKVSKQLNEPQHDIQNIIQVLKNYKADSIVGEVGMNSQTHELGFPITIYEGTNVTDDFKVLETYSLNDDDTAILEELSLIKNSYTNPYLFF